MMRSIITVGGVALGFVLVILIAASWHFSNIVIYPRALSPEESYDLEVAEGRLDPIQFEAWPKEEVQIQSSYGYEMFGLYIPRNEAHAPLGTEKVVILCHGIANTLYGSARYVDVFRQRGFNVLMIDFRNHGRSDGTNTSYGFYEKHDLTAWVDWVMTHCGETCRVGTHGVSLGAATAIQHAASDPRVAFCIADCSFASASEEFAYRLKVEYGLSPFPLVPLGSLVTKLRADYFYGNVRPIADVATLDIPVLFIHGQADDYIPPEASIRMHDAKPAPKQLYLVPNARHAGAYGEAPEAYDHAVGEFLEKYGFLGKD
jgi:uncharacterized protein